MLIIAIRERVLIVQRLRSPLASAVLLIFLTYVNEFNQTTALNLSVCVKLQTPIAKGPWCTSAQNADRSQLFHLHNV